MAFGWSRRFMVISWHFVAGEASVAWETDSRALFWPIGKLSGYGWLGVELFFLISGFVICMSSWGRTAGLIRDLSHSRGSIPRIGWLSC